MVINSINAKHLHFDGEQLLSNSGGNVCILFLQYDNGWKTFSTALIALGSALRVIAVWGMPQ